MKASEKAPSDKKRRQPLGLVVFAWVYSRFFDPFRHIRIAPDSAPPPANESNHCAYRGLGGRVECERSRLSGSQYCFWHHETTAKYASDVLSGYFGDGVTLQSAIEAEVKSGRSLAGAFLEEAWLKGNWFEKGADLSNANLKQARLRGLGLSYGSLRNASLQLADLEDAQLGDVDLSGCNLTLARLFRVKLRDNSLSTVRGLELDSFRGIDSHLRTRRTILEDYPDQAARMYRELTTYFSQKGDLEGASWAAYRQRLMQHRLLRKRLSLTTVMIETSMVSVVGRATEADKVWASGLSRWITNWLEYVKSLVSFVVFGYGEKPIRVALFSSAVIVVYAIAYWGLHAIEASRFADAVYFSVVTFTTLGYGDILPTANFRLLAASEAGLGIVLTGLFLFTLARRASGRS